MTVFAYTLQWPDPIPRWTGERKPGAFKAFAFAVGHSGTHDADGLAKISLIVGNRLFPVAHIFF